MSVSDTTSSASESGDPVKAMEIAKDSSFLLNIDDFEYLKIPEIIIILQGMK